MQRITKDQIDKTKWDFVPLDRMIPLKTAVNIFDREYKKVKVNYLDRKFQRLRELYFSLFVCKALDVKEKKEHFLLFYERPDHNDVSFISVDSNTNNGAIQYFDVKEYINKRNDINNFLTHIFEKAKYKDYNLIIGVHADGQINLNLDLIEKSIFFVSSIDSKNNDVYKSKVKLISNKKVAFDEEIDLNYLIDNQSLLTVFHNKVNFK